MPRTKPSAMVLSRRALLLGGVSAGAILAIPKPAKASFSLLVTSHTISNGGTAVTTGIDTTGAKLITLAANSFGSASTITDFYNNVWTPGTLANPNGNQNETNIFFCINPIVGPGHTFTVTSAFAFGSAMAACAWSCTTGLGMDVQAATGGAQPGSVTPNGGTSLIVSAGGGVNVGTPACSGFTIADVFNGGSSGVTAAQAYLLQSVAVPTNPTWSGLGGNPATSIMVFNAFAAPPTTELPAYLVDATTGDITSLGSPTVFDDHCGPDMTYFQKNAVCGGTAADSTHIVLTGATASVVGHPIQWLSGNKCMCIAFNAGTQVATVSGTGGYSANFGGTPQNGDAYTVFPTQVTFTIGYPASGNQWIYTQQSGGNQGCWIFSSASGSNNYIHVTSAHRFDATKNVGDINSQPVPCLTSAGNDHASGLFIATKYAKFDHLQIYIPAGQDPEGCIQTGGGPGGGTAPLAIYFDHVLFRNDAWAAGNYDHQGLKEDFNDTNVTCTSCKYITCAWQQQISTLPVNLFDCDLVCTSNLILTATGSTSSGGNTITVASTAGISSAGVTTGRYSFFVSHPSIPFGIQVNVTNGTTLTFSSGVTTAAINIGDKIYLGPSVGVGITAQLTGTMRNCNVMGFCFPVQGGSGNKIAVNVTTSACDTDVTGTAAGGLQPVGGATGLTKVSYAALYPLASQSTYTVQLSDLIVGTPDLRLAKAGAALLQFGTARASGTDFFDRAWGADITVGAEITPPTPGGANFFHASPF